MFSVDMFDLTTARENYESALSVARILGELLSP